jgi:hypothetical protein
MSTKRKIGKRVVKKEEEAQYELEFLTESGFSLEITPIPPYYLDIIEDVYPFLDYPTREIVLLAGDIIQQPYNPPEDEPDSEHEDYDIFHRWHDVDRHNTEIKRRRNRARRDLLLSLCIEIKDGPIDIEDPTWITNLEAPFGDTDFKVPEHEGQKKLMFLKYIVIRSTEEAGIVVQAAMYKEVTLEGISTALSGFPSKVGRNTDRESIS